MSEQVELRLLDLLHNPAESPYGNPIPGHGDIRPPVPGTGSAFDRGERLSVVSSRPGRYTVVRLTEAIQTDPELLSELSLAGVRPGQAIEIAASGGYVTVRTAEPADSPEGGVALEVNEETASHIIVER